MDADDILEPFRALLAGDIVVRGCRGTDPSLALEPERVVTEPMVQKRAHEFLTGRTCARRALRDLGVVDEPLLQQENRAPRWPTHVVGSISHTDGICIAAVASAAAYFGIGIDVEKRDAVKPKLERYIATPAEIERHAATPRWRTLAFSGKEALFKCLNPRTGLWLEFRDVELLEIAERSFLARVAPKDVTPFEVQGVWVETPDYVLSAVVLRADDELVRSFG